jgi:PAS domain S-box-containing protein
MNGNEDKYRILVEQSPDGIAIYDQQGQIHEINDRAIEMLGYTRAEALPRNVVEVIAPEDLARQPLRTDLLRNGQSIIGDRLLVRKDGTRLPVELNAKLLSDGRIHVVLRDITERKRLEHEIVRSRDFYLTLLEDFPALVWRAGVDGLCDHFNRTWLHFTGRTLEQELGDGWTQELHPDDLDRHLEAYRAALEAREPFTTDYRLRRHDGVYRWMHNHGTPFYDADGSFAGFIGSCYDIDDQKNAESEIRSLNTQLEKRVAERTLEVEDKVRALSVESAERKRVEEALRVTQSQLRRLVDANIIGVRVNSFGGDVLYTNDAFLKMIGYTRADFDAGRIDWKDLTPSEYFHLDEQIIEQLQETGICDMYEKAYKRKDGSLVFVLAGAARLEGSSDLAISYVLDVTEQKEGELERVRLLAAEQAARRDAEEAVHTRDELLAIVSHDLKNPLTAIKGYSQLLRRRLNALAPDVAPRLENVIERVDESSNKMNQMLNDLLDFGRLQAGQPLSLQRRLVDLVGLARNVAKESGRNTTVHHIVVSTDEETLTGRWDAGRLEQMLSNLLSNAIKYSPSGGTITIRIEREHKPSSEEEVAGSPASWAVLTIEDEGIGIAPSELPHIFEWYRRARDVARSVSGAGIGLASARYIITQHGGDISVVSERGKGTKFTVRLPLS